MAELRAVLERRACRELDALYARICAEGDGWDDIRADADPEDVEWARVLEDASGIALTEAAETLLKLHEQVRRA